ncbi:MAG: hypothetical protein Q7T16_05775 [Candidatus Burarchaeum sp.]|nr:hypothetical protein [Candidatus Burarchaeum sp.]MDO8340135.1 hypothetical protein [Candidatus Burarchaeum sp.]
MRGAIMTTDALIASLVIILIIVAWAQAHSLVVGGAANEARLEAKKMRLVAYADAIVRDAREGNPAPTSAAFRMRDVQVRLWSLDENKPAGTDMQTETGNGEVPDERICIRRLIPAESGAKILEVCA